MVNDKTEIMGGPAGPPAIQDTEQQCPNCDAEMLAGEQFCPKCGYQRGTWQAAAEQAGVEAEGDARFELRSASGGAWPVYQGENEIGRGDVRIRLDNPYASRLHARIVVADDGTATIEDLGSSNGTIVGGEAIPANEPQSLAPGTEFTIGEETFSLTEAARGEAVPEAEGTETPGAEAPEAETPAGAAVEAAQDGPEEESQPDAPADDAEQGLMMSPWSLTIGDGAERQLPVGETVIGRKAGNGGIAIEGDGYVSGTHCKVTAGMDRLTIEDLGSTNGTKVDGELLTAGEPVELEDGAIVTVGQTAIAVSHDGAAGLQDTGEANGGEAPEEGPPEEAAGED